MSFADHIHRFNPAQRFSRAVERLEPHHQFHNSLDVPMILLKESQKVPPLKQIASQIEQVWQAMGTNEGDDAVNGELFQLDLAA